MATTGVATSQDIRVDVLVCLSTVNFNRFLRASVSHAEARLSYRLDVCLSVRLSHDTLVLCRNGSTYRQTVFLGPNFFQEFQWKNPQRGR